MFPIIAPWTHFREGCEDGATSENTPTKLSEKSSLATEAVRKEGKNGAPEADIWSLFRD
jgi:hypothetical protein